MVSPESQTLFRAELLRFLFRVASGCRGLLGGVYPVTLSRVGWGSCPRRMNLIWHIVCTIATFLHTEKLQ